MDTSQPSDVTTFLQELSDGNTSAADRLFPLIYDQFRALAGHHMRGERPDHTLAPTALVHEAYLKLVDQNRVNWRGRTHFFAVASQAMRRILVDHARHHQRLKRGGGRARVILDENVALSPERDEDVLALDEALERLGALDPRQARVVELRFFAGLTVEEVAEALGVSKRTVEGDWTFARAWLRKELSADAPEADATGDSSD